MAKKTEDLLPELESLIQHHEKIVPAISKKSIGWQMDHALKVINAVCKVTPKSDPKDYKPEFNMAGFVTIGLKWFPRGKGKAPKAVVADTTSEYELTLQLKEAREGLKKLRGIESNQFFIHPLFGHLNKKKTLRFVYTHTYHHLKIMRDILKG